MKCDSIWLCKSKPLPTDKLVECRGECCKNGNYFHLPCLHLKRMPDNHGTTWKCAECKKAIPVPATSSSDDDIDIAITKVCQGKTDKTGTFAKMTDSHFDLITSPTGWLDCDIIQQAQVLLQLENTAIDGFQRPTLRPVRQKYSTFQYIV